MEEIVPTVGSAAMDATGTSSTLLTTRNCIRLLNFTDAVALSRSPVSTGFSILRLWCYGQNASQFNPVIRHTNQEAPQVSPRKELRGTVV